VITSRRTSWARHVGERSGVYRILVVKPMAKRPRVDGRIKLRWIFRKWDGGHGLD